MFKRYENFRCKACALGVAVAFLLCYPLIPALAAAAPAWSQDTLVDSFLNPGGGNPGDILPATGGDAPGVEGAPLPGGGLDPIPGDANGDGRVGRADYSIWADQYGETGPCLSGDFNHDGNVDGGDYTTWADHDEDSADYSVWADHYGQTGPDLPGDFNHDGTVDGADYTIWADR